MKRLDDESRSNIERMEEGKSLKLLFTLIEITLDTKSPWKYNLSVFLLIAIVLTVSIISYTLVHSSAEDIPF